MTRNLKTYNITLRITLDPREFGHPSDWEFGEMIDPNCDPGIWTETLLIEEVPLDTEHAGKIAGYDDEPSFHEVYDASPSEV